MSLGAWLLGRTKTPEGLVPNKREGKLDWKAATINRTLRLRQIGRFRRAHGEATFEMPIPQKAGEPRSPYRARKLWISRDPTSKRWRVTRVSARGPEGHGEFASWDDAVYDAMMEWRGSLSGVTNVLDGPKARRGGLLG